MKNIIYVKGSDINDVRLHKFLHFLCKRNMMVSFWGWSRDGKKPSIDGISSEYVLKGGGYGKKRKLFFFYILWAVVVFFKCLRTNLKNKIIIAIDFDSAFPIYLASKLKQINFVYEIYDDFSLRYRFPKTIKNSIHNIDCKIMKKSKCVIHVDENRVLYKDCKWIVIENTPNDIYEGKERSYDEMKNKFAVIGLLSKQRGIMEIYKFAQEHSNINFLVVGVFLSKEEEQMFKRLPNVEVFEFMLQEELYKKMYDCCAIFSLYDPSVDINKLAASNKVYDAMMHGIPVITNKEVVNSKFIKDKNIGFVINYNYDDSWKCLIDPTFIDNVKEKGKNGRKLFLDQYLFDVLVEDKLVPILSNL